jgi:hypothetical protein
MIGAQSLPVSVPVRRADAERLCRAYRVARGRILAIADPVERELGLASLRLRATHFFREAATTAVNFEPNAWAPLKEHVEQLAGGEGAEWSVAKLDEAAVAAANAVLAGLLAGLTGGAMGAGLAAALALGLVIVDFGSWVAAHGIQLLLATHAPLGLIAVWAGRGIIVLTENFRGPRVSLGYASDAATADAAALEGELWQRATGLGWHPRPFTAKARTRAEALVWLTYVLLGLAALLFVIGFVGGIEAAARPPSLLGTPGGRFP